MTVRINRNIYNYFICIQLVEHILHDDIIFHSPQQFSYSVCNPWFNSIQLDFCHVHLNVD